MKKALPQNGKIAKDRVLECVSEFMSSVTSEVSDKCQEKRKTINSDDLLWAMATLGFEDYIEPLRTYLARYREAFTNLLKERLLKEERRSYVIPVGGSNSEGT